MTTEESAFGGSGVAGSTCVVTGASSGIGKAAATDLARMGARVVMVCRNRERGRQAMLEIMRASGSSSVDLLLGDLSRMNDVRRIAAELTERFPHIDVLVNNAGGYRRRCRMTEDGLEETLALNHLAPYLLTRLLLPVLKSSVPSRVINVASEAHRQARIDPAAPMTCRRYRGMRAYGRSKLANILFTRSLAHRLEGTGVTVNAMHPGVVATRFGQEGFSLVGFFFRAFRPLLKTPEEGAHTIVHLATDEGVGATTGAYFIDERERRPSRRALDRAVGEQLWEASARLVDLPAEDN